jgi:hypothetical protein
MQKAPELHKEGLVQTQTRAQFLDLIGPGILAQQKHDRIAHVLKQQECNEGDGDHDDHGLKESLENESKHGD